MVVAMGRIGKYTAAGCDRSQQGALTRCAGEAAEIIAQSRTLPDFMIAQKAADHCPSKLLQYVAPDQPIFVDGIDNISGKRVSVPASMLNFNIASPKPILRSSGCAAGPTRAQANLAAIAEIAEHASTTRWWQNRQTIALCPLPEDNQSQLAIWVHEIRGTNTQRETRIAKIETLWGFHICVAWSWFTQTHNGFMIASGANLDINAAAQSALRELMQMEWGLCNAISAKNGEKTRFAMPDPQIIDFSNSVRPDKILLHSQKIENEEREIQATDDETIKSIITEFNIECISVILHEEPGLSVIKAIIPSNICNSPPFL